MISLEIYKLDCEDSPISTLNVGEHNFGRGTLLECDDRRVSRNHGLITITNDKASIISTHQNPCFYIYANSQTITILPRDSPVNITDGDKFALLADQFWYKLKLKVNNNNELPSANATIPESNNEETDAPRESNGKDDTLKRPHEDEPNSESKKIKILNANEVPQSKDDEPLPSISGEGFSKPDPQEQPVNTEEKQPDELDKGLEAEEDSAQDTTKAEATASTSSNKRPWRDYCVYGTQCYRKSAAHLKEFTHPGDSDYESDPKDQRPTCSYGSDCYRKNKVHRKAYKHPRGMTNTKKPAGPRKKFHACNCAYCHINPSKKPKTKVTLTIRTNEMKSFYFGCDIGARKRDTKKNYADESSEDDYDMDDPFMAGDSSSEYECDGESNESESESSGDPGDEEFKRMLKEAKRFTRQQKKD